MGLEGKTLQGRYLIERQVGLGGMGAVYIASDQRFNSTVAIKQTLCMDDNYRMAIEREARLLNSLKHNALPRVIDHFIEENGQFLVMEFIPGEDLNHILEESGRPFEIEKVMAWADELLDALDFLHNQEVPVIHRDIKPQNLKVSRNGSIVLLDFGLAKGTPTESNNKTAAKSIFGYSRNYASLEQIQGTGTDPRSDLYSLAATLYHLAAGTPPEDALTRAMAVLSDAPDPLVPPHLLNSAIPPGVSAILMSAMDLNAANRPASAAEMRSMLAEHSEYAGAVPNFAGARSTAAAVPAFAPETRLMPETRAAVTGEGSEAKTRLMSDGQSVVTKVKGGATTVNGGGYRKIAFAAGGLAVLLMAGIVAGALFAFESDRELPVETQMQLVPSSTGQAELAQPEPSNTADVPSGSEAVATAEAPVPADAPREAAAQPSQPKKPTQRAGGGTPNTPKVPDVPEIEEIIVDGETVYMGNTKITSKGIEPFNGKLPKPPAGAQPPRRIMLRDLTPEQRRRLQYMRQYNFNVRVSPTPSENP